MVNGINDNFLVFITILVFQNLFWLEENLLPLKQEESFNQILATKLNFTISRVKVMKNDRIFNNFNMAT